METVHLSRLPSMLLTIVQANSARFHSIHLFECWAVTEFLALCLPMDALSRCAGIDCAVIAMRHDCPYSAGKMYVY